jgi:phospholipid/cholesterol/gamma-HCH transport system substrate-binding protein
MFISLEPKGSGQLQEDSTIPVSRTKSPYNVVQAFSGLADRAERIDTERLADSIDTLAELTKDTPAAFQSTLRGLSRLSETVASRNDQIGELLGNLDTVSGTLAERDEDIIALMKDSDVLLRALVARREAVHQLLVSTSRLSTELTLLVQQTRADLKPALSNLQGVVNLLLKNQSNLDESLRLMAPFYRVFANTLGSGPWFDTWIQNLPPAPDLNAGG